MLSIYFYFGLIASLSGQFVDASGAAKSDKDCASSLDSPSIKTVLLSNFSL